MSDGVVEVAQRLVKAQEHPIVSIPVNALHVWVELDRTRTCPIPENGADRFRRYCALFHIVIVAVSFVLPYGLSSQDLFVMSAFLFKYGWWFISPYLLAKMTTLDPSGRLITATNFVIAFGQTLSPFVDGLFLVKAVSGQVIDYAPAMTAGRVNFVFCCVLFIPLVKSNDRLLVRDRLQ